MKMQEKKQLRPFDSQAFKNIECDSVPLFVMTKNESHLRTIL